MRPTRMTSDEDDNGIRCYERHSKVYDPSARGVTTRSSPKPWHTLARFNLNCEIASNKTAVALARLRISRKILVAPFTGDQFCRTHTRIAPTQYRKFHTGLYLLTRLTDFSTNNSLSLLGNFSIMFYCPGVHDWMRNSDRARADLHV